MIKQLCLLNVHFQPFLCISIGNINVDPKYFLNGNAVTFYSLILSTCMSQTIIFGERNHFWRGQILALNERSPFLFVLNKICFFADSHHSEEANTGRNNDFLCCSILCMLLWCQARSASQSNSHSYIGIKNTVFTYFHSFSIVFDESFWCQFFLQ